MSRRFNCRCGKKRYRDEEAAVVAAAADTGAFGGTVTAYRCPGGLAWHLTAHGYLPEGLRTVGRRLAHELLTHGEADLAAFRAGLPAGRHARADRCAEQLAALGAAHRTAPGRLTAADPVALRRVIQIGLDAYAQERSG